MRAARLVSLAITLLTLAAPRLARAACASDADCAATEYCDSGTCTARLANGAACTGANSCTSGFCVDGVCCNQACDGQCEACDIAGAEGTCVPVVGTPHGSRPACQGATGADVCAARLCDGANAATCVGYAGAEVGCRDAACTGGAETLAATCNGTGQCPAAQTASCGLYACGDTACKTTCASDADCAQGYRCSGGSCAPATSVCDGDHTIVSPGGTKTDCTPFRCDGAAGLCKAVCASDGDCVTGLVCDAQRICASASDSAGSAAPSSGDSAGCSIDGRATGTWGASAIALVGLALVSRRRRTRD